MLCFSMTLASILNLLRITYVILLTALDGVNIGTATVCISVQDVNDEHPVIHQSTTIQHPPIGPGNFVLDEDNQIGQYVGTVLVVDVDSDVILYQLSGVDSENFTITNVTVRGRGTKGRQDGGESVASR